MDTVKKSWSSNGYYGCNMYVSVKFLKALKPVLRQLCRDKYGDLHNRLETEKRKLHLSQLENLHSPHEDILQAGFIQNTLVKELSLAEEMLLRQKSRIQWIREGDKNTSFFHNMVRKKHFRDQINLLFDFKGNRLSTYEEITAEAIMFYQKLLDTPDPVCTGGNVEVIRGFLSYQPTATDVDLLLAEVFKTEIHKILKSFPSNKALGP